jgi:hypothetical protein
MKDFRTPWSTEALVVVAIVLVAFFAVGEARGDAVEPPPEDCPPGSRGTASHCGPHCSPQTCDGSTPCGDGTTCQERDLCIRQLDCMSMGGPFTADAVEGECGGGGACSAGTCQSVRVCVSSDRASPAGCGCTVSGSSRADEASLWLLAALGMAVGLRFRRR